MIIRHPLPLLTNEVPRINLNRDHSLLLMQDIHRPFSDAEHGWLATRARTKVLVREFDEYFQALSQVAPNIGRVLAAVRALSVQVAFSCLGYRPPSAPSAFQQACGWTWALERIDDTFPTEWLPRPTEPIFAKPGWSALAEPRFAEFMAASNIRSVILLGTMFEFGIRQSCLELTDRGIGVLLVSDGVVALTQAGEKQARGELAHGLAKLRTTGELLDLLARLPDGESILV